MFLKFKNKVNIFTQTHTCWCMKGDKKIKGSTPIKGMLPNEQLI
jgi:hypothetical protein